LSFGSEDIYKNLEEEAKKLGFKIEDKSINISGKCKNCK
jgi:hypothetical protein